MKNCGIALCVLIKGTLHCFYRLNKSVNWIKHFRHISTLDRNQTPLMPTKPVPSAAQDRIQSVKTPFQESPVLEPEPGLHCSQSLQASPPALNAPPARHGHRDASGCGTEGVVHG